MLPDTSARPLACGSDPWITLAAAHTPALATVHLGEIRKQRKQFFSVPMRRVRPDWLTADFEIFIDRQVRENAPLFRRLRRGERVARVQMRVAEDRVDIAVVLVPAGLGENLDAPAARPRVLGRIRILVDADLLHGRRADVQRGHFHPVDDNGDARVAERARIEKPRHRGDVVVVEHRQAFQHARVNRHRVDIVRRRRPDVGRRVAHGDFLREPGDPQDELLRARSTAGDAHARRRRCEALVPRTQLVLTGGHPVEAERARAVGDRGLGDPARGVQEVDRRAGQHRPRLVLHHAGDDDRCWALSDGRPGRCGQQEEDAHDSLDHFVARYPARVRTEYRWDPDTAATRMLRYDPSSAWLDGA